MQGNGSMVHYKQLLQPIFPNSQESVIQWLAACAIIILIPLSMWNPKFLAFLLLPFLLFGLCLVIKYPAFLFMVFVASSALEGGFVSEVRTITLTRLSFLLFSFSFVFNTQRLSSWRKLNEDPLWVFFALWVVFYALSFLWTANQELAAVKLRELLLIMGVCTMGYLVFRKASLFEYKMFIAVYVAGTIALMTFMYTHIGDIMLIGQLSERTAQRVTPFSANSYGRAIMVAVMALVSLSLFARRKLASFLFTAFFTAAALGMIVIAGSRSSVVIFFVSLCMMFLLHEYLSRFLLLRKYTFYFLLFVTLVGFSLFLTMNYLPENLSLRIVNLFSQTSEVIETNPRVELYKRSLDLINEAPFIGGGISGFYSYMESYPHNMLLEITLESGIIGLFLFLCFFLIFLFRMVSSMKIAYKHDKDSFGIFFSFCFMTIAAWLYTLFIGELTDHRIVYFLTALLLALDYRVKQTLIHHNQ